MLAASVAVQAQAPKFVELVTKESAFQGKIVARSSDAIWLMQRDGRLRRLKNVDITSFRKITDQFVPYGAAELRDLLRREFRDLEVVGTGHYLVVGPSKFVRGYAQTFEDQYRSVRGYFSVRGFDLPDPEFPLVAMVFPNYQAFAKHAQSDGFKAMPGLRGYYTPSTNRIALYHEQPVQAAIPDRPTDLLSAKGQFPFAPWTSTEGDLESTMIHEATHQVAFNIGIHNRLGNTNPRWLVEGLATAFEAPGMRNSSLQKTPGAKLNHGRFTHFREFLKTRRRPKSLESFIANGNLTGANVLDGYAQSWALTYFLIETRPRDYAKYLKLIAARPPFDEYTDDQHLSDFREAFGNDLVLLEAKFLRFIEQAK